MEAVCKLYNVKLILNHISAVITVSRKSKGRQEIGLPWWLRQWRIHLQWGRPGFDPWVGKIPCRRAWQPTPVFLPGEAPGQRSLAGYMRSQRVGHEGVTKPSAAQTGMCGCNRDAVEWAKPGVPSKSLGKEALKSVRRPWILRYRILCTCVKINIFGLV